MDHWWQPSSADLPIELQWRTVCVWTGEARKCQPCKQWTTHSQKLTKTLASVLFFRACGSIAVVVSHWKVHLSYLGNDYKVLFRGAPFGSGVVSVVSCIHFCFWLAGTALLHPKIYWKRMQTNTAFSHKVINFHYFIELCPLAMMSSKSTFMHNQPPKLVIFSDLDWRSAHMSFHFTSTSPSLFRAAWAFQMISSLSCTDLMTMSAMNQNVIPEDLVHLIWGLFALPVDIIVITKQQLHEITLPNLHKNLTIELNQFLNMRQRSV